MHVHSSLPLRGGCIYHIVICKILHTSSLSLLYSFSSSTTTIGLVHFAVDLRLRFFFSIHKNARERTAQVIGHDMPLRDCLPCAISTGNTTTIGRETRDMQTNMQSIHESIEKICRAHLQHIYAALTSNVLVEGDLLKALLNSPLKSLILE